MQLRRLSKPELPIPLELIKLHCRIDEDRTDEDINLALYAQAAVAHGESLTGRVWPATEFELTGFTLDASGCVVLPVSPVTELVSIAYLDAGGDEQDVADADYNFTPSTLLPNPNPFREIGSRDPWNAVVRLESWPDGAVIRFKAGWSKDDFPDVFIQWALVKIAAKHGQREDISASAGKTVDIFPPEFVDNLLNPYKRIARM